MTSVSRWLLALLMLLGIITLTGFAIAIQGVRLGQQRTDRRVTEVTRVVTASPCANLTIAECFHRLVQGADQSDLEVVRGE